MGDGGGGSLSKLGIVLTVIFVSSLFALLAQIFYALWRRRASRRQTYTGGGADRLSIYSSSDSSFSSKELLYFFCMRRNSDSNSNAISNGNDERNSNRQVDVEIDFDLLKLQGVFGPPRFLFTIKEEEREGFESPADKSLHSADKEANKFGELSRNCSKVSLEECFKAADSVVEVKVEIDIVGGGDDATPYSTPCASPAFFSPSISPAHDDVFRSEGDTAPLGDRR